MENCLQNTTETTETDLHDYAFILLLLSLLVMQIGLSGVQFRELSGE